MFLPEAPDSSPVSLAVLWRPVACPASVFRAACRRVVASRSRRRTVGGGIGNAETAWTREAEERGRREGEKWREVGMVVMCLLTWLSLAEVRGPRLVCGVSGGDGLSGLGCRLFWDLRVRFPSYTYLAKFRNG